jgi:hypothetical protein
MCLNSGCRLCVLTSGIDGLQSFALQIPNSSRDRNEKRGLPEQLMEAANFIVRIPMRENCDSIECGSRSGGPSVRDGQSKTRAGEVSFIAAQHASKQLD